MVIVMVIVMVMVRRTMLKNNVKNKKLHKPSDFANNLKITRLKYLVSMFSRHDLKKGNALQNSSNL